VIIKSELSSPNGTIDASGVLQVPVGATIIARCTVANIGLNQFGTTDFEISYYISSDKIFDREDYQIDVKGSVTTPLGFAESANVESTFILPEYINSQFYILFHADSGLQITESNENNNYAFELFNTYREENVEVSGEVPLSCWDVPEVGGGLLRIYENPYLDIDTADYNDETHLVKIDLVHPKIYGEPLRITFVGATNNQGSWFPNYPSQYWTKDATSSECYFIFTLNILWQDLWFLGKGGLTPVVESGREAYYGVFRLVAQQGVRGDIGLGGVSLVWSLPFKVGLGEFTDVSPESIGLLRFPTRHVSIVNYQQLAHLDDNGKISLRLQVATGWPFKFDSSEIYVLHEGSQSGILRPSARLLSDCPRTDLTTQPSNLELHQCFQEFFIEFYVSKCELSGDFEIQMPLLCNHVNRNCQELPGLGVIIMEIDTLSLCDEQVGEIDVYGVVTSYLDPKFQVPSFTFQINQRAYININVLSNQGIITESKLIQLMVQQAEQEGGEALPQTVFLRDLIYGLTDMVDEEPVYGPLNWGQQLDLRVNYNASLTMIDFIAVGTFFPTTWEGKYINLEATIQLEYADFPKRRALLTTDFHTSASFEFIDDDPRGLQTRSQTSTGYSKEFLILLLAVGTIFVCILVSCYCSWNKRKQEFDFNKENDVQAQ